MKITLDTRIDKNRVFNILQCREESDLFRYYEDTYENIVGEAKRLVSPVCYYKLKDNKGKTVPSLENASQVIYSIVSIGPKLNNRVEKLFSENLYLEAMMLNIIGDTILFNASSDAGLLLRKRYSSGGKLVSGRRNPGTGGIPNEFQGVILEELKEITGEEIGIFSGHILTPEKSLSAVYGVGEYRQEDYTEHDCRRCQLKECIYKNEDYL